MSDVPSGLRPMSEFDPTQPAVLHELVTGKMFTWTGDEAENFRQHAVHRADGQVELDGLVFDGWGNVLGG